MKASADLTGFEGQLVPPADGPMPGPMSVSREQAGIGGFVLLLDGQGVDRFVSGQRRSYSDFPLLMDPHEAILPRLPGSEVERGDSWVDTVTTFVTGNAKRVVAYTYTLVSDTIVDGRAQLRIAVSGDSRLTQTEEGITTILTGPETGFFLWDIERGLVAWWEVSRGYEGSVQDPMVGLLSLRFNATTRIRLEN